MENLDELSAANSKVGSPATKISDRTSEEMTMDGSSLEQNPISIPSPRGDLKELLLCSKTQVVLLERMLANLTRNGEKELRIEPKSEAGNSVSVDENDVLRARPDVGIVPTPEIDETGTGRWSISSLFFPSLLGKELEYWNVDNYPSELQRQELKLGIQTYFSDWMNNDKSSKWNGIIERNWPQILTTLKTSFKDLVRRDWRQNPEYVTLPGSWDIFYHFFAEETPLLVDFNV
jgi:hypothetical protein